MPWRYLEMLCDKRKRGVATALAVVALLSGGCASSGKQRLEREVQVAAPITPQPRLRDIKDQSDYAHASCSRHVPSEDGRRSFFGMRLSNCRCEGGTSAAYLVGFFHLNGLSPAKQAGIQLGDRIESIKGCRVNNSGEVRIQIEQTAPGSTAFVGVGRPNGQRINVPVRTIEFTPLGGDVAGRAAGTNLCSTIGLRAAD